MYPDPTPRMPWSSDRPKVPRKAKRTEKANDRRAKKKRIGGKETSKTSTHMIKSQQKEKERRKYGTQKQNYICYALVLKIFKII